ncbi:ABC transporter substrate-binding protein [Cohnella pontilimi]|uniref:ABC transporter substrate-binding protein n=1 Tax=Cohnella pontilimi TaxID=2564100 RepID=UPI00145C7E5D|nr:extracellular solute-binding protein [Cohnella pontilimi]
MKAKKWLSGFLAATMIIVLLAACGKGNSNNDSSPSASPAASPSGSASAAPSDSSAPAKLEGNLVVWTYFDQVKILAESFMAKNPGVKVDVQIFPGDQYETKLMTALQTGQNAPDIVDLDRGYIGKFLESPYLADLSAMGGDDVVKDHIPYVKEYGKSADGKLRAISDNSSPGGFWYVRESAKKWLGTDDPDQISAMVDSWDKIVDLGKKVAKDSGGKVHLIQSAGGLFDIMAYNTQPWVQDGKLVIDPKWKETYETQLKIRNEGVDAKLGFMSSGWGSALNNGDVVLTSMPSWATFMIDNKDGKAKGKFGVAKTPEGWFIGGRYEGIYEKSKNKELAFEFLKYVASPEWQLENLQKTGNMPSNALVFDQNQDSFKMDMLGDQLILKAYADQMKSLPGVKADKYNEGVLSKWGKVAGEGINNNTPYDKVVQAFKKEVKNTYPEIKVE